MGFAYAFALRATADKSLCPFYELKADADRIWQYAVI